MAQLHLKKRILILGALGVIFFGVSAWGMAHKFYLSVTQIGYNNQANSLEITSRVFADDLNQLMRIRYGIEAQLETPTQHPMAATYLEAYWAQKFTITVNEQPITLKVLGVKKDQDMLICFIEGKGVSLTAPTNIVVQNKILTDLFEDQQNVVHLKVKGLKKSFLLMKDKPTGVLNIKE